MLNDSGRRGGAPAEAGCTRGALYHQFAGKEEVASAVVGWVRQTWWEEVGQVLAPLRLGWPRRSR
ncbi:hypothetical protein ACIQV1_05090 [Streptomyces rubiginosohelvolus]|uniref:hypothetical protein n=1 Tax=Streptomyces rubiginosohelvolus TaxID=67362 RepID=UPI00380BF87A